MGGWVGDWTGPRAAVVRARAAADLEKLYGKNWATLEECAVSPQTQRYIEALAEDVAKGGALLFLCHHFLQYNAVPDILATSAA